MRRRASLSAIGQLDMILNAFLGITVLFILAYLQIKPPEPDKPAILPIEGKYVIQATWPDGSTDDVDLWVRDPGGNTAWFSSRDVGLMHLEHDDLGARSDRLVSPAGEVAIQRNEERVILRGVMPGEYVVNVHMYHKRDDGPTPVTISLYRLDGEGSTVAGRERVLERHGDEKTAFRFTIDRDESVTDVSDLPLSLVSGQSRPAFQGFTP